MDTEPQTIEDLMFPPNRRIPVSQSIDTEPTQITINFKSFPKIKTLEETIEEEESKTGRRSFLDFL